MKTRFTVKEREDIEVNDLAGLIGCILKEGGRSKIPSWNHPPSLLAHLRIEDNPHPEDPFFSKFFEAIALLKQRGLVMDVIPKSHVHYIHLTSDGEKSDFGNEILILDDAQESVNAFDKENSKL